MTIDDDKRRSITMGMNVNGKKEFSSFIKREQETPRRGASVITRANAFVKTAVAIALAYGTTSLESESYAIAPSPNPKKPQPVRTPSIIKPSEEITPQRAPDSPSEAPGPPSDDYKPIPEKGSLDIPPALAPDEEQPLPPPPPAPPPVNPPGFFAPLTPDQLEGAVKAPRPDQIPVRARKPSEQGPAEAPKPKKQRPQWLREGRPYLV